MTLSELLQIRPGLTLVIGGGGKTALLRLLGEENRPAGVVLSTSTQIYPFPDVPLSTAADADALRSALGVYGLITAGTPTKDGKLAAPAVPFTTLAALAKYVFVEADGSRGLPIKAHAPHEPVLVGPRQQTVLVLGADAFGRPICDVAHRPALFAALAGAKDTDPVTPELAARVLSAEGLHDRIFINKVESAEDRRAALTFAGRMPCPVTAGSLQRREWTCLS